MKKLFILFTMALTSLGLLAQTKVTGTVVDKSNQPLVGVQVMPASGGEAVTTDFDGRFEITIPDGEKLTFSTIGVKSKTEAAQDGMVVILGGKNFSEGAAQSGKWNWREQKWEHMLSVTYGISTGTASDASTHTVGLHYGMCHYAGFYVGFETGMGFHMGENVNDLTEVEDASQGITGTPIYTGRVSHQNFGVSAGAMWRMYIPLYGYAGLGYGYRSNTYETSAGRWLGTYGQNRDELMVEVGLVGDIKYVHILAGVEMRIYNNKFSEACGGNGIFAKVGVGFTLPDKKLNERLARKGGKL